MVRFTDDANRFWLEQSLDKGEMPKRDDSKFLGITWGEIMVLCELCDAQAHARRFPSPESVQQIARMFGVLPSDIVDKFGELRHNFD